MSIQRVTPAQATDGPETDRTYRALVDLDDGRRLMRRERDGTDEYAVHGGARTSPGAGMNHVTVNPTTGERYGSTELPVDGPYTADQLEEAVALSDADRERISRLVDAFDA